MQCSDQPEKVGKETTPRHDNTTTVTEREKRQEENNTRK
jgi:hypothetical protein